MTYSYINKHAFEVLRVMNLKANKSDVSYGIYINKPLVAVLEKMTWIDIIKTARRHNIHVPVYHSEIVEASKDLDRLYQSVRTNAYGITVYPQKTYA